MGKKIIKLTESDLVRIIERVISENTYSKHSEGKKELYKQDWMKDVERRFNGQGIITFEGDEEQTNSFYGNKANCSIFVSDVVPSETNENNFIGIDLRTEIGRSASWLILRYLCGSNKFEVVVDKSGDEAIEYLGDKKVKDLSNLIKYNTIENKFCKPVLEFNETLNSLDPVTDRDFARSKSKFDGYEELEEMKRKVRVMENKLRRRKQMRRI